MVHATVRCLSYVVVDLTLVLHVEELVSPSGKNFLFNFIKTVFSGHISLMKTSTSKNFIWMLVAACRTDFALWL